MADVIRHTWRRTNTSRHVEIAFERVAHPLGERPELAEVASRVVLYTEDFVSE